MNGRRRQHIHGIFERNGRRTTVDTGSHNPVTPVIHIFINTRLPVGRRIQFRNGKDAYASRKCRIRHILEAASLIAFQLILHIVFPFSQYQGGAAVSHTIVRGNKKVRGLGRRPFVDIRPSVHFLGTFGFGVRGHNVVDTTRHILEFQGIARTFQFLDKNTVIPV
ncbi:unknown [Odoribacter sp. CAG:788]|nr:unknown [Odoribacter sp. CAG:788]